MARILRAENLYLPSMSYARRRDSDDRGSVVEDRVQSDLLDIVWLMYRPIENGHG